MYRLNLSLVSVLAFIGLVSACEDDHSRGPKNGVADATLLSGLSSPQAAVLCKEFDGYTAQVSRTVDHIGCTVAGLMFGGKGAACEKYRSECLPPAAEPAVNCDTPAAQAPLLRCPLSVGEYRACLEAVLEEAQSIDEAATCESNAADVPNYTALQPGQCQIVRDKCPELLPD